MNWVPLGWKSGPCLLGCKTFWKYYLQSHPWSQNQSSLFLLSLLHSQFYFHTAWAMFHQRCVIFATAWAMLHDIWEMCVLPWNWIQPERCYTTFRRCVSYLEIGYSLSDVTRHSGDVCLTLKLDTAWAMLHDIRELCVLPWNWIQPEQCYTTFGRCVSYLEIGHSLSNITWHPGDVCRVHLAVSAREPGDHHVRISYCLHLLTWNHVTGSHVT